MSCGEDNDASPDEPSDEVRDAGRKTDARVRDAKAADSDSDDPEEEDASVDAEKVPDARVRDAGVAERDAGAAASDASTRDASTPSDAAVSSVSGESGRMVGMTAAHNAVRAMVETTMSLPELTWSSELASYAQQWADSLAMTCVPKHRTSQELQAKGYGENWAAFTSFGSNPTDTAKTAVGLWASEKECWTFGTFWGTEKCDVACYQSKGTDGCGHYTQIVWRKSTEVGCGVATCSERGMLKSIWICNYKVAGNYQGQTPY